MGRSPGFHGNHCNPEANLLFIPTVTGGLPIPRVKSAAAAVFCLSPAIHSGCLSRTLLLQTWKSPRLWNLWYLCQLWDLSLVSSLDKPGLAGLLIVPQQCLQSIWLAWFDDSFGGISWAHAHNPGTHEPLGHWNSNVNTQILEEFPAGVPLEGTGMDTGPRAPVLTIIRQEERREGETLCLLTSPSLHHWLWDQGRRDTGPSETHDQHTEHYTAHWGRDSRDEKLTWHSMLIAWKLSTIDISTVRTPK